MEVIMFKKVLLASILVAATSSASFAWTPVIDASQNAQGHRIYDGVQSGQLTYGETRSLVKGQIHVQRLENRAKSDGVVTIGERARIRTAQVVQSARIFRKKHN
jgi:opacity protein-like surface antigen